MGFKVRSQNGIDGVGLKVLEGSEIMEREAIEFDGLIAVLEISGFCSVTKVSRQAPKETAKRETTRSVHFLVWFPVDKSMVHLLQPNSAS